MAERLAQWRRKEAPSSSDEFIDCDFIPGSVAEVERLWSLAKYVLMDHRRQMTPRLFEALVFNTGSEGLRILDRRNVYFTNF